MKLVWIRYRAKTRAGHKPWYWTTRWVPDCTTDIGAYVFFRDNHLEDLQHEIMADLGVEFEIDTPSKQIMDAEIRDLESAIEAMQSRRGAIVLGLRESEDARQSPKQCSAFPKCGCIVSGEHWSCKPGEAK